MARGKLSDYLQQYPFWMMDIAPIEPLSLPIFTPLYGFQSISSPELNLETHEISEANWFFKRKVIKAADVAPITCTRGVTFADSDFWRWINAGMTGYTGGFRSPVGNFNVGSIGGVTPRRSLLLVHFFSRVTTTEAAAAGILAGLQTGAAAIVGGFNNTDAAAGSLYGVGVNAAASALGVGPFEFAARVPAKAYLLHGCLPTRYKAGSDFDASSGEISIGEIEITPEYFEEIALSA